MYQLSIRALRLALRPHYVMHGSQLYFVGPNRVKYYAMKRGYDSNFCKYFWEVRNSMPRDYDTSYFKSRLFTRADLTCARNWPEFVTLVCSIKQLESASMDQSTKLAVVYTALDWLSVQTQQIGLRVSLIQHLPDNCQAHNLVKLSTSPSKMWYQNEGIYTSNPHR